MELYILLTFAAILWNHFLKVNLDSKIFYLLWFVFPGIIRFITLGFDVNELKEVLKILIMILLLSSTTLFSLTSKRWIKLFALINFGMVLGQFFKINFILWITQFFVRQNHFVHYSYDSVRATGIFADPATCGVVSLITLFYFRRSRFQLYEIIALITILLSQSKTVYIAVILYYTLVLSLKYKFLFIGLFIPVISKYYDRLIVIFYQMKSINLNLLNNSSFLARVDNWKVILKSFSDNLGSFLIGPGRTIYGDYSEKTSVIDSDYAYMILSFGGLGVLLMVFIVPFAFKSQLRNEILALSICSISLSYVFMLKPFIWLLYVYKKYSLDSR